MRHLLAHAAARAPRPLGGVLSALAGAARGARRGPPPRPAGGLSEALLGDLGLKPVAGPKDSRAHARGRAAPARRTVHEIDFAYYATLTKRSG